MRAVVYQRPRHVSVEHQPDPCIEHPRDAIVRVTATSICGSDLHIYRGHLPQARPFVLGHELVGVVEDVGHALRRLERGDRVLVPAAIACGACWFCRASLPTQCERSNELNYGPEGGVTIQRGGALFGYGDLYGGYAGAQAQYVRVPYADHGPRKIPRELSDEEVLFLGDVVPTAYAGLRWAGLMPGETIAVWGCGPVGLMTQQLARLLDAGQVFGIDVVPYRLEAARRLADSVIIDANKVDPVEQLRALTHGRGPDVVVEAVGMEVDRSLFEKVSDAVVHRQAGGIHALEQCFSAVRRGGRVSILGLYATRYDHFPLGQMVDKGLRVQAGQAPVHELIDDLLGLVQSGRLRPQEMVSHRIGLADAPEAYELFNEKRDRCIKVVIDPWR
jgi:S-(hydroxymethyl)glutathione dehydrogenase / alcohol dehydrogenase